MRRIPTVAAGCLLFLAACGGTPATVAPTQGASGAPTAAITPPTAAATRAGATRTASVSAVIPPATGTITTRTVAAAPSAARSATAAALPPADPVSFGRAPWAVGEKTTYAVTTRDGQQAGSATYTLGGEFEALTLSVNATVGATQDRYQIGFDGRTFAPASELRSIVAESGTIDIRAEYHANGATIEVIDRNGTVRNQLTLPPVYYANDQFLVILRALPFAEGYSGSMSLVPSQGSLATIPTVVTVVGRENVTTPLGTFACWKITAQFAGSSTIQTLWYGVEKPNYLVKYDTGRYIYTLTGNQ